MDYSKYGIEDLLSDVSFQEYCLGNNDASVRFWEEWLKNHPQKTAALTAAKSLYYTLNGDITGENFRHDYAIFRKAFMQLDLQKPPDAPLADSIVSINKNRRSAWVKIFSGIAATLLVAFGFYFYNRQQTKTLPATNILVYNSSIGKKLTINLCDRTKVILNGGSTLNISRAFNKSDRVVTLKGEGYFIVAHNGRIPFIVRTAKISVKDIGTVFNIKAYPEDKTTEASLIKGSVEVTFNNINNKLKSGHPADKIILTLNKKLVVQNDQLVTSAKTYKEEIAKPFKIKYITTNQATNTVVETDWAENKLTFYNQPFDEIAVQMQRWYGVKIIIANSVVKSNRFTATFSNENITQVLEALKLSGNFNYRKEGDVIIIY